MRKSAAKRRILEVADNLIREKGYATLNVNEIAHQAKVSIGTLYYHFPKGKSSILLETRANMADESIANLEKELGKEQYLEASKDFKDGLRKFLFVLLKLHRRNRQFLIAMEGETLTNMETYLEAIDNVDLDDLFLKEINASLHPIKELMKRFAKENVSAEGKEKQVHKVIDTLIHRHIYFGYNFGTDEEFIDMLTKIVYTLLRENTES
ncbi:MAG: TetR/AcrR family transcriptional regulator [Candidatus Bathyarchaeota archaeon]|nr:TetR/AcrR family transcriptional regulator [Candidatus Bathyarchaeota archaeon]MDH5688295.1 TetR/AcrR family transcriptional regulator [Candidatus Bathyarchaeota archaeon]